MLKNQTADTVTQMVHLVASSNKLKVLQSILQQRQIKGLPTQCIIFANSRIGCARLSRALSQSGIKAEAIHGDKSQVERMSILDQFKKGEIDALVATDVAARGLDIPSMPCVINYELPFNAEDYVHRIGRTGRAGAKGDAIALVDPSEMKLLADIEKLTKKPLIRIPAPITSASSSAQNNADPFFYMPYQSEATPIVATSSQASPAPSKSITPQRSIGALLGGIKKT
jgi:superfamily II DNA/RNA helicase